MSANPPSPELPVTELAQIVALVEQLAIARARVAEAAGRVNTAIEQIKLDAMPELRELADQAAAQWTQVQAAIEAAPQLFENPRKHKAHGVVFGMEMGKGSLEIADPDKTVSLIERHFPDQAEVLIDVKKTPAKAALAKLPAQDLKRLGVTVQPGRDQVVLRPADGEVDKIVKALVKAAIDEGREGA